jgi:hypothetical protein
MSNLELFKAVDGIKYWNNGRAFVLLGGQYSSGHGAIQVYGDEGPELKLTVNLSECDDVPELHEASFFARVEEVALHRIKLLRMGLFAAYGNFVSAGYVQEYAQRWRFARCDEPPSYVREHMGHDLYAVQCDVCRARWEAEYEDEKTARRANDAVRRLKGVVL